MSRLKLYTQFLPWLFFVLVMILGKLYHEAWMDEWRNLSLVIDAKNLQELYIARSYESHPMLYYIIHWVVYRLTHSMTALFVLHGIAAAAVLAIIWMNNSLRLWEKYVISLSTSMIYEVTIFSRQYIYIWLFFLAILFIQNKWWRLILFLLVTHLHVYAWLMLIPLFIYYFHKEFKGKWWVIMLVGLNLLLSYLSAALPPDTSNIFELQNFNFANLEFTVLFFNYAYLNTLNPISWLNSQGLNSLWIYIIACVILWFTTLYIRDRKCKIYYLITIGILFIFNYHFKTNCLRHVNFYFFAFIIYTILDAQISKSKKPYWYIWLPIMAYQLHYGISHYIQDIKGNYSQSKAVVERINHDYRDYPVVSAGIFAIDAPSGYLGKPVWSLHEEKSRRYYSQRKNDCALTDKDLPLLLSNLEKCKSRWSQFALIVSLNSETLPLRDYLMANQATTKIYFVQNFESAIEPMENYYLFVYRK